MKILNKCENDIVCDVYGCKNKSTSFFEVKGLFRKLNLCSECQNKLFEDLSKNRLTKSPQNKISVVLDEKQGVQKGKQNEN